MSVALQLQKIRSELPPSVTLVAVSKTKPISLIQEAYQEGQRHFGENYIQELVEKQAQLPQDICWHAIGHLQSNKVKYIAPFVYLIHGVDSLSLLKEINKQGQKNKRMIKCLLQIHIAQEETKFGFSFSECENILASGMLNSLPHVQIQGFMGMASNTNNKEQIRNEFKNLHAFFCKHQQQQPLLQTLSMGMSSDYSIAVEQGSTMLRLGSSIFGERVYH
ncbi:MAG: YggS family pyridoxal phosphate-dependent enzyme [Bacteroidetes bacterium]|nr:YggS family pyridoxal phosphate-dependent enzyme [Bacteroidota bacterium]